MLPDRPLSWRQRCWPQPVKVVSGVFKPTGRLGIGLRIEDAELKLYWRLGLAKVVAKDVYQRLLSAYHIPNDSSPFR